MKKGPGREELNTIKAEKQIIRTNPYTHTHTLKENN